MGADEHLSRARMFQAFLAAGGTRVVPVPVTRRALVAVSHTLEGLVAADPGPAVVVAGFQRAARWDRARRRYGALLTVADREVVVLATGTIDPPDHAPAAGAELHLVALPDDHPLADDWFLVTVTSRFRAALFGQQLAGPPGTGERSDDRFVAAWSFDPEVVSDALAEVVRHLAVDTDDVADVVSALGAVDDRLPPVAPPDGLEQRFAAAVFDDLARTGGGAGAGDLADAVAGADPALALGRLTRQVAHDLAGPLTTITAAASVLADVGSVDTRRRMAASVEAAAGTLGRLVRDLHAVASPAEAAATTSLVTVLGELGVEPTDGRPGPASDHPADGPTGDQRTVRFASPPDDAAVDALVHAPPSRVRLVLDRVLDHAWVAGGRTAEVVVGVSVEDDEVRMDVEVAGPSPAPGAELPLALALASLAARDLRGVVRIEPAEDGARHRVRVSLPTASPDGAARGTEGPEAASRSADAASGATDASSGAADPAGREADPAGRATDASSGAADPAGREADPAGREADPAGRTPTPQRSDAVPPGATGTEHDGTSTERDAAAVRLSDPASRTAAPVARTSDASTSSAPSAAEVSEAAGIALVVDDEPAIRGLLEALLRRGGWDVVCASDRAEALAAVAAASFDAVLLDLRLADVDGRDLLVELSEAAPGVWEVAAFVTGAPPADGRVAGRPVLGKPFAWTQLAALLEQIRR
jgi:CheY-like chemotaxis protein/DICT domain-containing protein